MLNSGLGNQMFQYIFALYLSQNGAHVMIDDSAFFGTHVEHNGLEVPRFFPKGMLPRLSEHFTPDVWTAMLDRKENGMSIPDQLLAGGIDLHYVRQDDALLLGGRSMKSPRQIGMPFCPFPETG